MDLRKLRVRMESQQRGEQCKEKQPGKSALPSSPGREAGGKVLQPQHVVEFLLQAPPEVVEFFFSWMSPIHRERNRDEKCPKYTIHRVEVGIGFFN